MKFKFKKPEVKINLSSFKKIKFSSIRKINLLTILSLLAYVNILSLITLLFSKKSQFLNYHSKQGVALLLLWALFGFSFYLPFLFWIFAAAICGLTLYGFFNVLWGRERPLPIVGKLAERI